MVNDVTSPVAAARYYAYINLAANETAYLFDKNQRSFGGVLNGFEIISVPDSLVKKSDQGFAVILALYKTSIRLLPSGYMLKKNLDSLSKITAKKKIGPAKREATNSLAEKVVEQVMKYAYADGFVKLSGLRRFTPRSGDEYWQPTAPGFISAIEPYWYTLRTFVLDSCSQFSVGAPAKYDTDTSSGFYKQMKEVYELRNSLTRKRSDIAMFWDCNPFALQQVGHLEFGLKKISPGGHWMGITGIACKKNKLSLAQTAYAHAFVSVGLSDAFISCWNNKYKFNRVRPETAIKRLLDRNWNPLLQTPPFPEYTSGHSVISTTAAIILTNIFGDQFSFTDDSEMEFGLPARKFNSFTAAAKEAAISRLYGGIHFRDAIENGVLEGEQIGRHIVVQISQRLASFNNSKTTPVQAKK
jgi:hypothetical protein